MAVHGSATKVWMDGLDMGEILSEVSRQRSRELADVSTFSDSDHRYVAGQTDLSVSASGVAPNDVDYGLPDTSGSSPLIMTVAQPPATDAGPLSAARVPAVCWSAELTDTAITDTSTISDAVLWALDAELDAARFGYLSGRLLWDRSLHGAADNSMVMGGAVDLEASSPRGAVIVAHVLSVANETLQQLRVQHSADGSVWTNYGARILNSVAAGSVGAYVSRETVALQRYVRFSGRVGYDRTDNGVAVVVVAIHPR